MIHFDDHNAGKLEKAINRAFSVFAIIVFPLSLLAIIAFVSQTGMFQPGPRMEPEPPKLPASNWAPPILDNSLIHEGDTKPTPTADTRQAAARRTAPTPTPSVTASPTATATQLPPGAPFEIFNDALAPGWSDQSWGASVNFASTNPVYAGLHAISYTATSAWAGLDLRAAGNLNTANYRQLRFALQATRAGQEFAVYLRDTNGAALTKVPLATYGGAPPTGTWKIYTIPLSDLGAANITLGDLVFHEWSGTAQPAIYIDSIQFISDPDTATPTPTPVPPTPTPTPSPTPTPPPSPTPTPAPSPTPSPTPTPAPTATPTPAPTPSPQPSGPLTIYADAFAGGWDTSQSWDATINSDNRAPVYAGSASVSYVANRGWAGLQIWNGAGIDASRFTYLRFAIRATQPNEPFAVYLRSSKYADLTDPIPLSRYGGYPGANGWTVYTIPLADLNPNGAPLGGIVIHDWSDSAEPAIYVDAIQLLP